MPTFEQQQYTGGATVTGPATIPFFPTLPGFTANGVMVMTTLASGMTLTVAGRSVTFGNLVGGTFVPVRCTAVTLAGTGSVMLLV